MHSLHVVLRVESASLSLVDDAIAPRVWRSLQRCYPEAFSAVLMPDHFHVVTPARCADEARMRCAKLVSGWRRSAGAIAQLRFERVPQPSPVSNAQHALRVVRYVALNPCRERLAGDPFAWLWSTYRDVFGAAFAPWVSAERLARVLARRSHGFESWLHAYVSGDPSVDVRGTPLPIARSATDIAALPLRDIARAAAMAVRAVPGDIARRSLARRVFVQLAHEAGWRDRALVARTCGITRAAVGVLLRAPNEALAAARLCLGDSRLVAGVSAAPLSGATYDSGAPSRQALTA